MGKFIKYNRIKKTLTIKELKILFDTLIKDGCEIIHYEENHIKYNEIEVLIIYGKVNNGNKQIL